MQSFHDAIANYNADPSDKRAINDLKTAFLRDLAIEQAGYSALARVAKLMRVDVPQWKFGHNFSAYTCNTSVLRSSDGYISAYNCDIDQYKSQYTRLMQLIEQKVAKNSGVVEGMDARIRIDGVKLNDQEELIHEHEHTIDYQVGQIESLEQKVKDCNQANGELIARIVRLENSTAVAQRDTRITALQEENKSLCEKVTTYEKNVGIMEKALADAKMADGQWMQRFLTRGQDLRDVKASSRDLVDQKEKHIIDLQGEIAAYKKSASEMEKTIKSQSDRIEQLSNEPNISKLQYESLIGETAMKIDVLKKTIAKQVGVISTVKGELAESIKMGSDRLKLINELNKKIEDITQLVLG